MEIEFSYSDYSYKSKLLNQYTQIKLLIHKIHKWTNVIKLTITTHSCPFPILPPSAFIFSVYCHDDRISTSYWSINRHRDSNISDSSLVPSSIVTWLFKVTLTALDSSLVSPSPIHSLYLHFALYVLNNLSLFFSLFPPQNTWKMHVCTMNNGISLGQCSNKCPFCLQLWHIPWSFPVIVSWE